MVKKRTCIFISGYGSNLKYLILNSRSQNFPIKISLVVSNNKKAKGLIDFSDMIVEFIKSDASPKFDVVFIDEAQDLSKMQWNIWNCLYCRA